MSGTALAVREPRPNAGLLPAVELEMCREAIARVEVYCYETWEFDGRLTKDAARRLVVIAEIFGWDMEWVTEMRVWSAA